MFLLLLPFSRKERFIILVIEGEQLTSTLLSVKMLGYRHRRTFYNFYFYKNIITGGCL